MIEWLIEEGIIQYQCQMSMHYNYATYGENIIVLFYVDDCVYWYTYESLRKWFLETLGNILHVNFLGYAHGFMSISIS